MWVYQAVTNVGIQVLLLMALGYVFARFRILEQSKFLPISNFIVLMLALPAFNLYLMGIRLDLQKPEPWKSLAAFLVWVFTVQGCTLLYTWRWCGGDAGEAAVINMVLLMDNYAITGLLALNATLGTKWGPLALLMAMGFFLVIFPFSLAAFEWEKWAVQQHLEATAAAAVIDIEAAAATAAAAEEDEAENSGTEGGSPGGPGSAAVAGIGTAAAAAAAEAKEEDFDVRGGKPPAVPSGGGTEPLLPMHGPKSAEATTAKARARERSRKGGFAMAAPVSAGSGADRAVVGGGREGVQHVDPDGYEVTLYGMPERGDIRPPQSADSAAAAAPPPPAVGTVAAPPSAASTAAASAAGPGSALRPQRDGRGPAGGEGLMEPLQTSAEGSQTEGFPHEGRYCWWSNAEYCPAHPMLPDIAPASAPATEGSPLGEPPSQPLLVQPPVPPRQPQQPQQPKLTTKPSWPWQRAAPASQEPPDLTFHGTYIPPEHVPHSEAEAAPTTPTAPAAVRSAGGPASSPAGGRTLRPAGPSPFQGAAAAGWPSRFQPASGEATEGSTRVGAGAADGGPGSALGPGSGRVRGAITTAAAPYSQPTTAPSSARRRAMTAGVPHAAAGGAATPERHPSFLLPVLFDRLAEAGSGQLPQAMFGDILPLMQPQGPVSAGGLLVGSRPTSGMISAQDAAEKPLGVEDLEFALTHQIMGGTASQMARLTRGYSAAVAAATAAATSGDTQARRLLIAAANSAMPPGPGAPPGEPGEEPRTPMAGPVSGAGRQSQRFPKLTRMQPGSRTVADGPRSSHFGKESRQQPAPTSSSGGTSAGQLAATAGGVSGSPPSLAPLLTPQAQRSVAADATAASGSLQRGTEAFAPPALVSSVESYGSAGFLPPPPLSPLGETSPPWPPRLELSRPTSAMSAPAPLTEFTAPPASPGPALLLAPSPPDSARQQPKPASPPPTSAEAAGLPSQKQPQAQAQAQTPQPLVQCPTFGFYQGPPADSPTHIRTQTLPPCPTFSIRPGLPADSPTHHALPPCPTFSARQGVPALEAPWHAGTPLYEEGPEGEAAAAAGGGAPRGLSTMSSPMFSFGRSPGAIRSVQLAASSALGGGAGDGGSFTGLAGRSHSLWQPPAHKLSAYVGTPRAAEQQRADRALLALASGLALSGNKPRGVRRAGDATPGARAFLRDSDGGNIFMRLATAASALDPMARDGGEAAAAEADKRLVREATAEVLRRHGGVAGAFRAFVSGHPQLWHIVSTLARNPMIWTMFIAMTMSVSGLRIFLDPASPHYRPEVGWVAGTLSWINGLVVPMSIFSNGAWMYGKPVLPKGEVVKMVVLLFIKLGLMPLLMAGCAIMVQLDGQHVAAMTVLTLSPAAAASFVLAVQYGRGVELVSLTNILGNVFLTPLLIMWLKILTALNITYTLHEDI